MLGDIIVTANKREQSASDVPMSITAISGDVLEETGINELADLGKLTAGYTYTVSHENTPILTIRGIGYYDVFIGGTPAVSAYIDEVSLPYPVLSEGAFLDLERVEVLKGPQGTLFGQNSTGGALNFIAAKPTEEFEGSVSLGYGRFNHVELAGHVSGPVSEHVGVRVAAKVERGDAWQYSYTRNDKLGELDKRAGRVTLDYDNESNLFMSLTVEGWQDKSEGAAPQLRGIHVAVPPLVSPRLGRFDPATGEVTQVYPNAPRDTRAADWTPVDHHSNNKYFRASGRLDYELTDALTLTSITSFQHLDYKARHDPDATALYLLDPDITADVDVFSQELRLAGQTDRLRWTLGANYQKGEVDHSAIASLDDWSPGVGATLQAAKQVETTYAAFGNIEFDLTPKLTAIAGARYTDSSLDFDAMFRDIDGRAAAVFEEQCDFCGIYRRGGSISLNDRVAPSDPRFMMPDDFSDKLEEDNVSWRLGLSYKFDDALLLYGNVSQGYKVGAYTLPTVFLHSAAVPATQENVIAYEAGFKYDSRLALITGAVFHYDYTDKQILAPFDFGPPFDLLDKLQNIPESRVNGVELQAIVSPFEGLRLNFNVTYLDSKVTGSYVTFDPLVEDALIDLKGKRFPYTPTWQGALDASYTFDVRSNLTMTLGGTASFRSDSDGRFAGEDVYRLDDYVLLDLRAAIETVDGRYSLEAYGRNVADKYYATNVTATTETIFATTGPPSSYGVRLTARF